MANRALNALSQKSESLRSLVTALGIGWAASFVVGLLTYFSQNWFWFAVSCGINGFCLTWFFFWYFYSQLAQLMYMNAAAIVESHEAGQKRFVDAKPVISKSTGKRLAEPEYVSESTRNLDAEIDEVIPASGTSEAWELSEMGPTSDDGNDYFCLVCSTPVRASKRSGIRTCPEGHTRLALIANGWPESSAKRFCLQCDISVIGSRSARCPACGNQPE